jgi:hypothetical protein
MFSSQHTNLISPGCNRETPIYRLLLTSTLSHDEQTATRETFIQDEHKVSVHLMITIQNVTSNVQSVPRHSSDIY